MDLTVGGACLEYQVMSNVCVHHCTSDFHEYAGGTVVVKRLLHGCIGDRNRRTTINRLG